MFKRVDRRRRRIEIEETLGLDEDERGVLGLHDTDSSESDSDSDESASSSATTSDVGGTHSKNKRKRGASLSSYDESDENEDGESESTTDDEKGEERRSNHGTTSLTIASVLQEPIRLIRPHPEAWVCTFCPGKILKHADMVKVHEASRIHRRRFKRAQDLAMEFSPDEDIRNLISKSGPESQHRADNATLSRRAEERKARQMKLKEKRKKIKERKAAAMAMATTKKATKMTEKEAKAGHPDEAIKTSKRSKFRSSNRPGKVKNVHRTSLQADTRRIPTKGRSKGHEGNQLATGHPPGIA